jgi:hypothetical protein
VPRLGMQRYNFGGEALHGVWASCVVDNVTTATHTATGARLCATQFGAPVQIASSLNKDLWRQMADVSSTEARALYGFNTRRHPGLLTQGGQGVLPPGPLGLAVAVV